MSFDPGSDFLTFDGLQSVTYRSITDGTTTDTADVTALVREVVRAESSDPAIASRQTVIHLLKSQVTSAKKRDRVLLADGTEYVVTRCRLQTLATRWRLECTEAL